MSAKVDIRTGAVRQLDLKVLEWNASVILDNNNRVILTPKGVFQLNQKDNTRKTLATTPESFLNPHGIFNCFRGHGKMDMVFISLWINRYLQVSSIYRLQAN